MSRFAFALLGTAVLSGAVFARADEGKPSNKYFAHAVVEDRYGVIAPWYSGQNGQCDLRIRVAAETLKRYPWTEPGQAVMLAPHFIFNGHWNIDSQGRISINRALSDWDNGDIGQRSASLLLGLTDYYRYTGDPAALGIVTMTADFVLDYCRTPADHAWPLFMISAPTKGKAYSHADPRGFIQLDLTAWVGSGMVAAYKLTGNRRYWNAAKHWADLLAERCDTRPGAVSPWPRYANPDDVDTSWKDNRQTAGVVFIVQFLDAVIHTGYRGEADVLVKARDAGDRYLRDKLLPQWTNDHTFGHHFWDWDNPVVTCTLPSQVAQYIMSHRESYPDWRTDVRNIVAIEFCRFGVDAESAGGVYSGAWAFPESSACCGKSLQYPIVLSAATLARYGVLAQCDWAREVARRQSILFTYDAHETGVVEDRIDGGTIVAGIWFNLAHPWPLKNVMDLLAWQPELMGANRENHIMRTTSVVRETHYGAGRIEYSTYDAQAPSEDVLRLAFVPKSITADGRPLKSREDLSDNGYTIKELTNGDCLLTIRHDGLSRILIEGDDPQEIAEDGRLRYEGAWTLVDAPGASGGELHVASTAGASASFEFQGNQVRLVGRADPHGGKADVYLDGVKQLCGIDFWCPRPLDQQIVWYRNGLAQGKHSLKIVAHGAKNARAGGVNVYVDALQWSAAGGKVGFGEGAGPAGFQRVLFGYEGRQDYMDTEGHAWRPALEFVTRLGARADLVPLALWTAPRLKEVANTKDPELYRYGVHANDLTAYFTVDPKRTYHVRIKLCQADVPAAPGKLATSIDIQGKPVAADVDIAATAGGLGKAVDLVFNDVEPKNGVIAIRFRNGFGGEAMVQAIEIGPGRSEGGARPVRAAVTQKSN